MIASRETLFDLACQLDEQFEDGASVLHSDRLLVVRAKEFLGEILRQGRNHPLWSEFTRLVTGTITLNRLWNDMLKEPVVAADEYEGKARLALVKAR